VSVELEGRSQASIEELAREDPEVEMVRRVLGGEVIAVRPDGDSA
jgi:hypothetical protein